MALKNVKPDIRVLAQLARPRKRNHLKAVPGWHDGDKSVASACLSMTLVGLGAGKHNNNIHECRDTAYLSMIAAGKHKSRMFALHRRCHAYMEHIAHQATVATPSAH